MPLQKRIAVEGFGVGVIMGSDSRHGVQYQNYNCFTMRFKFHHTAGIVPYSTVANSGLELREKIHRMAGVIIWLTILLDLWEILFTRPKLIWEIFPTLLFIQTVYWKDIKRENVFLFAFWVTLLSYRIIPIANNTARTWNCTGPCQVYFLRPESKWETQCS